jgi:ferredoxin
VTSLELDAARCDGVGMCLLVAPDLVTLDRWGFPVIEEADDARGLRQAKAAARACPHRALRLAGDQAAGSLVQRT